MGLTGKTENGYVFFYCGFCSIYGEAFDATGVLLGKDAKKVRDAVNRAKRLWGIRLRCRNWGLTPLIILNYSWELKSYISLKGLQQH